MKKLLFLAMALLFTAAVPAMQPDTLIDSQLVAASDVAPVYIDSGQTDMSAPVAHTEQIAATFDPGDPCPATHILPADNSAARDYLLPHQTAKRKPIANALHASLSVNLPDKVPR